MTAKMQQQEVVVVVMMITTSLPAFCLLIFFNGPHNGRSTWQFIALLAGRRGVGTR